MNKIIEHKNFGEERALYALKDAEVRFCAFKGEEDGESALKETRNIDVNNCEFHLRYPLWHTERFSLDNCEFKDTSRAAIWYAKDGKITNSTLGGIKAVRECENITLENTTVISEEFGWKSTNINICSSNITGAYAFFDCRNVTVKNIEFKGKYSFQYVKNLTIEDSFLDTKDAFWHAENVTVRNSTVKGEYLAWFSENLTLENCKIIGTQPLCYCKGLKLINCEMIGTDLSFENSDVEATLVGNIISIKNPRSGYIEVDEADEVIFDGNPPDADGEVLLRLKNKKINKNTSKL